jgi:hypothetical protein
LLARFEIAQASWLGAPGTRAAETAVASTRTLSRARCCRDCSSTMWSRSKLVVSRALKKVRA